METFTASDGTIITYTAPPAVSYDATARVGAARTLFGTTPRGLCDSAGLAQATTTYGVVPDALRWFCGSQLTSAPTFGDPGFTVGAFKSMTNFSVVTANGYDRLIFVHEIDRPDRAQLISIPNWKADMGSMVAKGIPGLTICLTAWCFNPASGRNPDDYLVPGVTHLAVDFDGISQSHLPYHDYSAELAAVVAFCERHDLTWGVAEFGANRAADDPYGSVRAAWLITWASRARIAGAEYFIPWEQTGQVGSTWSTPAESAAMAATLTLG